MLKRILIGVTGTPTFETKVSYALDLAERHGADIAVLSIIDVDRLADIGPVPIGGGPFAERLAEGRVREVQATAERAMQRLAEAAAERGVRVTPIVRQGDPLDVLTRAYRYFDILALSLHGWFDDAVISEPENALLKLLAGGVQPVLAVSEQLRPVDRVLVAYNGSPEAAKAIKRYVQLRLWGETPIEIVCGGDGATGEPREQLLEDAANYVRSHGLPVTTAALDDGGAAALLAHADAIGADLIVMGGSYRRVLLSQRFGAHTLGLFKTSHLPLFIAH